MNRSPSNVTCRLAELSEIIELRHDVLRPGMDRAAAMFEADEAGDTLHIGAFDAAGLCIACASAMLNRWQGQPAYQLRGMATREGCRGRGIGRQLLRFTERCIVERTEVRLLWCNARVEAADFYARHGWRIASEAFEIPTVGPHYRMLRQVRTER